MPWPIADNTSEAEMGNEPGIQWRQDVDGALADAKRENRPVLIDFTAAPA